MASDFITFDDLTAMVAGQAAFVVFLAICFTPIGVVTTFANPLALQVGIGQAASRASATLRTSPSLCYIRLARLAISSMRIAIMTSGASTRKVGSCLDYFAFAAFFVRFAGESLDVLFHMIGLALDKFQVADRVVELVVVFMMDNLFAGELSTEVAFHYVPMFQDSPAINSNVSVSINTNGSRTVRSFASTTTGVGALNRTVFTADLVVCRKLLSAALAIKPCHVSHKSSFLSIVAEVA